MSNISNMRRRLVRSVILFALTFLLMGALAACTGLTLGLFLGGLVLSAIVLPYCWLLEDGLLDRLLMAASVVDAVGLTWLVILLLDANGSFIQWLNIYAILLGVGVMEIGITALLCRWRLGLSVPAGLSVMLCLLWLTAPLWLLHHLSIPWMQRLINVHPIFATNAAVPWSIWTEAPLAYQVLNLNQDVYYALPTSPVPCILLHILIGTLLLLVAAPKGPLSALARKT